MSLSFEELLDVKITGASLVEEKQRFAPSSVTVFTGDEIRQLGALSIEELMDYIPGFQSYQTAESGHSLPYSSRGRKVGTTSREVLVLLDDERIDTTLYGGAAYSIPLLSARNIERIEFMRGPGSALYGTGSFLGTINIVTAKNVRRYGLQAGSHGWFDGFLSASGEKAGVDYGFHLRRFQDEGASLRAYDPFSGIVTTKDPVAGDDAELRLSYKDWGLSYRRNYRRADDFYVLGTLSDGSNFYETQFETVSLARTIEWSPEHRSKIAFSYRWWEESLKVDLLPEGYLTDFSAPASSDPFTLLALNREVEFSGTIKHEWWIGQERSIVFGAEWRRPKLVQGEAFNNYDLLDVVAGSYPITYYGDLDQSTPLFSESARDVFGAFAQLKTPLGSHWLFTGGLRYDYDSLVSSRLSPRIAFVRDFKEDGFVLKLMYSQAFRSPSTAEMFSINNPVVSGNQNLMPEVVETIEVVAIKELENQVFTFSVFENNFEHSIVNGFIDGVRTFINTDEEFNRGLEVEYRAQVGEALLLRGTMTRLFSQPQSTFREAANLASLSANYAFDKWNLTLGSSYHGSRSMIVPTQGELLDLSSYWDARLSARYTLFDDFDIYLTVKNALDEKILTPPQVDTLVEGVANRGRQIRIGFEAGF